MSFDIVVHRLNEALARVAQLEDQVAHLVSEVEQLRKDLTPEPEKPVRRTTTIKDKSESTSVPS